jgi:hypothetical protein
MTRRPSTRALVVIGVVVSLLLAGVVSWYASSSPDGLERVAEDEGFGRTARDQDATKSPFSDYDTQGVEDDRLSGGLAGVIGVAVTGLVMAGLVLALRRRSGQTRPTDLPKTGD